MVQSFLSLAGLCFVIFPIFVKSQDPVISDFSECMFDCVSRSYSSFQSGFTESDLDDPDYSDPEYLPFSVKAVKKSCRILRSTEACIQNCDDEFTVILSSSGNVTVPKVNGTYKLSNYMCDSKKSDWQNMIDNCIENTKAKFRPECTKQCGGKDATKTIPPLIIDGLKHAAKTGSKDLIHSALVQSCSQLECWIPCQADYYKATCGSWGTKVAEFFLDVTKTFFANFETRFRLYESRFWPKQCENMAAKKLALPSEYVATTEHPFYPIDAKKFIKTPGVNQLLADWKIGNNLAGPMPSGPSIYLLLVVSTMSVLFALYNY